jgi:putative hemolysin
MDAATSPQPEDLDRLARILVARASPARFDLATTETDRAAVFRLRFDTVVEEGWASADAFPDGLECDKFDEPAAHVVGWLDGRLVAAARLVFPERGRQLPTEEEFDLIVQPSDVVVDVGRAIVRREYRSPEHTLFGGLLARCWLEVRRRGFHNLCGAATAPRLERYQHLGLPLRVIGSVRTYWGEDRYPVFLDGIRFADFVRSRADSWSFPSRP